MVLTSHSAAFHVVYIIFTRVWVFTPLKKGVGYIIIMAPTNANNLEFQHPPGKKIKHEGGWIDKLRSVFGKKQRGLCARLWQLDVLTI